MHILLFDIDGTLIRSGGAGKAAMELALQSAFGITEIQDRVSYGGRTDPAITTELLLVHDIEPSPANLQKLRQAYLDHLPACLQQNQGVVLPGIRSLLNTLCDQEQLHIGLLTGNVRAGAECKLKHFDLWNYFDFGGFGDHHIDRNDVAQTALIEAQRHVGQDIATDRVWVIGDTPLDVRCARAIGANAVVVATGWNSKEELLDSKPDWYLDDLSSPQELLDIWCP